MGVILAINTMVEYMNDSERECVKEMLVKYFRALFIAVDARDADDGRCQQWFYYAEVAEVLSGTWHPDSSHRRFLYVFASLVDLMLSCHS